MWQRLSLRARLNMLLAAVLLLGLVVNVARLLFEAGPRIQAEDQSVVRLARQFIETSAAGLNDMPDAEMRLDRIVEDINRLRHVSVRRGNADLQAASREKVNRGSSAPGWFMALIHPEQMSTSVPVTLNGKPGSVVITSHPDDEIDEIWDGIVTQFEVGSAIVVALLLVTMGVVSRALQPIQKLGEAMARIESGAYATRVQPSGPPELAAICEKLNHLAATLGEAMEERRLLAERIVSLQDMERKEIARELHDEFGPYHFALRAHADALMRIAATAPGDPDALLKHGRAMLEQVGALQQSNRRVLDRLRPVGLTELGLGQALQVLVRLWCEAHPDVTIETDISPALPALGEMVDLTIYRIVQEGMTNVFRHACATRVSVKIEQLARSAAATAMPEQVIVVQIRDNGKGLRDRKQGLGLVGMRERVMALGGSISVESAGEGVLIEAVVPGGAGDETPSRAVAGVGR